MRDLELGEPVPHRDLRNTTMAASPRSTPSPSTTRRWAGVGLLCLLGAGAAAGLTLSEEPAAPIAELTPGAAGVRSGGLGGLPFGAPGSEAKPCSFSPGARMAYAVHTRTSVELDMAEVSKQVDLGQAGQQQAAVVASEATKRDVERDWLVELEAVALEADGASILAARIQDRGVRNLEAGSAPRPAAALADTFLIRVDARCSIREFGWRSEGSIEAAREQQVLAAGLGFWGPGDASEAVSYGATGFDMTGNYKASYAYTEGGSIVGEVVSYAAPRTQIVVLGSTIEVELAPGQWFDSLTSERDLELSYYGVPFGAHFRSTNARQTALGDFDPQVDVEDGGWSWGRAPAGEADASASFDPALRELPFEDALSRYRELVASGGVSQYGAMLRDWLRANPEQTERVLAELRAGTFGSDQKGRGGIFYALGSANTPEAHAALVGILASSDDRIMHQLSAAHALAHVDKPTQEMLDTLREATQREGLHEVERGSMVLALGAFARGSATHDPELGAAARAEIGTWLDTPVDPADAQRLSHSLLAAGNAGDDELAPSIARYIDHEDPTVRRSATHAMRHMSPEAAYPQLERSLVDDDRVVRTAALETATKVARAHERAPSEGLAELAIDALASEHLAERGAAVKLLDEAAKHGSASASAALRAELRTQLDAGDSEQIAVLARGMSGQWKAPD